MKELQINFLIYMFIMIKHLFNNFENYIYEKQLNKIITYN